MNETKLYAIILAGGVGNRFEGKLPKKYIQDTIDIEKIRLLVIKNKSNWTKEAEAYYKNKLIKRINMIGFGKDADVYQN